MVRLRETTRPMIRSSPLSLKIGRMNFTDVSRVGHNSPGASVVCAASAIEVSGIVMLQPPCTVFNVLRKRVSGRPSAQQLNGALLWRQEQERQRLFIARIVLLARMRSSSTFLTLLAQHHLILYIMNDIYNHDRCQLASIRHDASAASVRLTSHRSGTEDKLE